MSLVLWLKDCIETCRSCGEINTQNKAEVLLDKFAKKLDEEVANLPEQVTQDVIDNLTKIDVEGDFVKIEPKEGSTLNVVSTFSRHMSDDGYINPALTLFQVESKNLFDTVNAFGGAGQSVTVDGVTCTINEDGTFTLDGTWTGIDGGQIMSITKTGIYANLQFPSGRYTVDPRVLFRPVAIGTGASLGNKFGGTHDITTMFKIASYTIFARTGDVFNNETHSLAFVRGNVLPESEHEFVGNMCLVWMSSDKKIEAGSIDWNTGIIRDTNGNEVEKISANDLPDLTASGNELAVWCGDGTVHVTGEKAGISTSNVNTSSSLDPYAYGLPVLKLNGNTAQMSKDISVDLEYQYGEKTGSCSVKWQGSSSLSYPKKNYTIKFDTAFEAAEGWGEHKKYCLKAYYIDYSHLRDRIGALIWGNITKRNSATSFLHELPNAGGVAGFPCLLVINGDYKGLYSFNIPKDPWMFGFADDDTNCAVVGMAKYGNITRFKAASVIDDSNTAFEWEHLAEGADEETMAAQFGRIYTAIQESKNKSNCYASGCLNSCVDMLNAIQHFIFSVVFSHRDGVGKNTLFVTNDGGAKWVISEYDMDSTLGNYTDGKSYFKMKDQTFLNYANMSDMFYVVYNYDAERLITQYKDLRKSALLESQIANIILNEGAKIPKAVLDYEMILWPGIPGTNTNNVAQMLYSLHEHLIQCDAEIEALEASLNSGT